MADIPVQRTSGNSLWWLWLLLAVLIIGLVIWWATDDDDNRNLGQVDTIAADTVAVQGVEPVGANSAGADQVTPPEPVAAEQGVTLAAILGNPSQYVGRDNVSLNGVTVPEVATDRGFWVADQGKRMFAIIIDEPQEVKLDINPGQRLNVSEAMVRDATFLSNVAGKSLDEDTKRIARNQDAFLVVDQGDINILSGSASGSN